MSCTRAFGTGLPRGSVTWPRMMTACAGVVSRTIAAMERSKRVASGVREDVPCACGRRSKRFIVDLLRFPLGSVAVAARKNRSPDWRDFKAERFGGSFPMRRASVEAAGTASPMGCALHSCGAVAEFHRASRTFSSGSGCGSGIDREGAMQERRDLSLHGAVREFGA